MNRAKLLDQYIESTQTTLRLWRSMFLEAIADEDLSPAQVGILFLLRRKQPITASDIARESRITKGAVTQFIEGLTKLGYIQRQTEVKDRRVSYLTLTKLGESKVEKLNHIRKKLFQQWTGNLSDAEIEQAIEINQKILRELEQEA